MLISGPANKIDTPSRPPGTTSSYSEIKPMLDLKTVLPDRSLLVGQKLMKNATIKKNQSKTFWVDTS